MDKDIQLEKTVFSKVDINSVTDRSFKTFVQSSPEVSTSIEDFFNMYDNLFYEIPEEGPVNSHRYLVDRSSELLTFESNTEDIQPLLDEIAQLREQLLLANQEVFNLQKNQP